MKLAIVMQAQYEGPVRGESPQALKAEDADSLVSTSTISPTSLESEAAFASTADPWIDGVGYSSGYAPLELPATFGMKVPGSGSFTESHEGGHGLDMAIESANIVLVADGAGSVRRRSWEEMWNRECETEGFAPTPEVASAPFGLVVARTVEMGCPESIERETWMDRAGPDGERYMLENPRLQMVEGNSVVELDDGRESSRTCLEQALNIRYRSRSRHQPATRLTSRKSSRRSPNGSFKPVDQLQSSIIPERRLVHGLLALSRAREPVRGILSSYQRDESSSTKVNSHDFEYYGLVATGRVQRAGIVDFPASNIRTALWDTKMSTQEEADRGSPPVDIRMRMGVDVRIDSTGRGQDVKQHALDALAMEVLGENRSRERCLPPTQQPYPPITADDWMLPTEIMIWGMTPAEGTDHGIMVQ